MMTREEIIEIEQYCSDHNVGKKARLAELGIPFWNFYRARRKYQREDELIGSYRARRKYQREDELIGSDPSAGNFIQLTTLPSGPALQPSKRMIRQKSRKDAEPIVESYLTIELRTASGTAMRIQGNMTSSHLRELRPERHSHEPDGDEPAR